MMMSISDSEKLHRLTEATYKNLMEGFNPAARNLISAGKSYLRALNGAVQAGKIYCEAITKVGKTAQQSKGSTCELGGALVQLGELCRDINIQHESVVKHFHGELLLPLEANVEQDVKNVIVEQKKYLAGHKSRLEPCEKAYVALRKHRKKGKGSRSKMDYEQKEVSFIQQVGNQQSKIDDFRLQGLRLALLQERKRYCYVLERHCAVMKNHIAFCNNVSSSLSERLDDWVEVSQEPEVLPPASENLVRILDKEDMADIFNSVSDRKYPSSGYNSSEEPGSLTTSHSANSVVRPLHIEVSDYIDGNSSGAISDNSSGPTLNNIHRSKSDYEMLHTAKRPLQNKYSSSSSESQFQKSLSTVSPPGPSRGRARALYAYISSGPHQLSFNEGDVISLIGDRKEGWQYGENLRTNKFGWFPLAYTRTLENTVSGMTLVNGNGTRRERCKSYSDLLDAAPTEATPPFRSGSEFSLCPEDNGSDGDGQPISVFGGNMFTMVRNTSQLNPRTRKAPVCQPRRSLPLVNGTAYTIDRQMNHGNDSFINTDSLGNGSVKICQKHQRSDSSYYSSSSDSPVYSNNMVNVNNKRNGREDAKADNPSTPPPPPPPPPAARESNREVTGKLPPPPPPLPASKNQPPPVASRPSRSVVEKLTASPPPPPPPPLPPSPASKSPSKSSIKEPKKNNPFTHVKLNRTKTNDRSAPKVC